MSFLVLQSSEEEKADCFTFILFLLSSNCLCSVYLLRAVAMTSRLGVI